MKYFIKFNSNSLFIFKPGVETQTVYQESLALHKLAAGPEVRAACPDVLGYSRKRVMACWT